MENNDSSKILYPTAIAVGGIFTSTPYLSLQVMAMAAGWLRRWLIVCISFTIISFGIRKITIPICKEISKTLFTIIQNRHADGIKTPEFNLYWQKGYSLFTVSEKDLKTLVIYINIQEKHHEFLK